MPYLLGVPINIWIPIHLNNLRKQVFNLIRPFNRSETRSMNGGSASLHINIEIRGRHMS